MTSLSDFIFRNIQSLLLLTPAILGFIVQYPCPTTPPCSCGHPDTNTIYCGSKHLTQFPVFVSSPRTYPSFEINIQNNAIQSIPNDAFIQLSSNFNRSFYGSIYLNDNQISNISDQAFTGINTKIYRIYLSNNNLTTIPGALATITNLDTLRIAGNPISTFDSATMSAIGKTLRHFWIDMAGFNVWPSEMGYLLQVFEIKMNSILLYTLPDDAFQNWVHLGSLSILNSRLDTLPAAICSINSPYDIYFNDNSNINNSVDIFPGCQNSKTELDTLNSITLKNNDLTAISNILSTFPGIEHLTVTGNPRLYYVMDEHVPKNHSLNTLTLDHNHFDRVPEALQKLNKLFFLDLSYNAISTLQRHDLDGFGNLHVIKLQNNPIIYVSSDAFISSVLLTTIYLENTNLTQIPNGVVALQKLTQLYLSGSPITCTCDSMSHLSTWSGHIYWYSSCNGTCVYLNGLCTVSQKNIADFIKNSLKKCP